jgi:DICT domain-containing protein
VNDFSIFEQALKAADVPRTDDLGRISSLSRRDFDERESFLFRTKAPSLEYASLMIENALLLRTNRTARVYVGFERLSCMQPVIGRYLRIADVSEFVYVFGEADWTPPRHPNVRFIYLSSDSSMAREWFLIADSSTLHVALVALDEDGFETPVLEERNFRAFKSSDPKTVAELVSAAEVMIDRSIGNCLTKAMP